jgi:hypothetical protein
MQEALLAAREAEEAAVRPAARMVAAQMVVGGEEAKPGVPGVVEESAARREVGEPGALGCSRHSLLGSDFRIVPFGIAMCRQGAKLVGDPRVVDGLVQMGDCGIVLT